MNIDIKKKIYELADDIKNYYNGKRYFDSIYERVRYNSIDMIRGLLVIFSILIIFQGLRTNIDPNYIITPWNGLNFADLITPGFLMLVGMSIPFFVKKYHEAGYISIDIVKKILTRSFVLFFLGVAYSILFMPSSGMFRLTGPYQLIAINYMICALIYLGFLKIKIKNNAITYVFLFMGIVISFIFTTIIFNFGSDMNTNQLIIIENNLMRLYKSTTFVDSYGIIATITSIPVTMIGLSMGCIINKKNIDKKYIRYKRPYKIKHEGFTLRNLWIDIKSWLNTKSIHSIYSNYYRLNIEAKKIINLLFLSIFMYFLSKICNVFIPMNRNVFSITFVLRTTSYMMITLDIFYIVFDIIKIKNLTYLIRRIGKNAILIIFSINVVYSILSFIKIKSIYTGTWLDFHTWFTTDFLLPITGIDTASITYSAIWTIIFLLIMNLLEKFDIRISV